MVVVLIEWVLVVKEGPVRMLHVESLFTSKFLALDVHDVLFSSFFIFFLLLVFTLLEQSWNLERIQLQYKVVREET